MKTLLLKTLLVVIAIAFIFGMFSIAELLASVISINTVIFLTYEVLGFSFIYLTRKEMKEICSTENKKK